MCIPQFVLHKNPNFWKISIDNNYNSVIFLFHIFWIGNRNSINSLSFTIPIMFILCNVFLKLRLLIRYRIYCLDRIYNYKYMQIKINEFLVWKICRLCCQIISIHASSFRYLNTYWFFFLFFTFFIPLPITVYYLIISTCDY